MTDKLIVIKERALLPSAIRTMNLNNLSVLSVVDESGKLVGSLSTADLIALNRHSEQDDESLSLENVATMDSLIQVLFEQGVTTRVSDVMTPAVETIAPDQDPLQTTQKLFDCGCHHLPALEPEGKNIVFLAVSDVIRAMAETEIPDSD